MTMNLEDGAYSALHTEKAYSLDVRDYKAAGHTNREKAADLHKHIENEVKATQSVVVRAYPDKLIISPSQYDILAMQPNMFAYGKAGQEFWLYRTRYNIMELEVKDHV